MFCQAGENPYKCSEYRKGFGNYSDLNEPMRENKNTLGRLYKYSEDFFSYNKPSYGITYRIEAYACLECGDAYFLSENWKMHLRIQMLTSPKAVSPVSFSSFSLDVPDGMESEDIFKEIYECICVLLFISWLLSMVGLNYFTSISNNNSYIAKLISKLIFSLYFKSMCVIQSLQHLWLTIIYF